MSLDELQKNIHAIPEENRARFLITVWNLFPSMVDLIDSCWNSFADYYGNNVEPAAKNLGCSVDEVPGGQDLGQLLERCMQMEELLVILFKDVGVTPRWNVARVDDTPSLFS